MVTLKVTVGTKTLPSLESITAYLSNTTGGPRMRSPWPFLILELNGEQAMDLAHNILEANPLEQS